MKISNQEFLEAALIAVESSNKQVMALTRRLAALIAEINAVKAELAKASPLPARSDRGKLLN